MKKLLVIFVIMALLTGCASSQGALAPATEPAAQATTEPVVETTEEIIYEVEASTHYMETVYPQQIRRYYTAVSQQWDQVTCMDNEISALVARYYEGNPLDNVGFAFMDLDEDGIWELVIGAAQDPLVFEIWALKDGQPVMLAQSGNHNRYYLQYDKPEDRWLVAYEAENGAANHAVYSLQLVNGQFQVVQGMVFDAVANEENPWFMTADLDWDVSNDTPIDEATANTIAKEIRSIYAYTEYFPYSLYK